MTVRLEAILSARVMFPVRAPDFAAKATVVVNRNVFVILVRYNGWNEQCYYPFDIIAVAARHAADICVRTGNSIA